METTIKMGKNPNIVNKITHIIISKVFNSIIIVLSIIDKCMF